MDPAAIDELRPATVAVLRAAAVCGEAFDLAVLTHAVAADPPLAEPAAVLSAISEGEQAGLVEPSGQSTTRYRFTDPGTVAALLASTGLADRSTLHLRTAEALTRTGGSAADLAHHLLRAVPVADPVRAVAAGRTAVREAVQRNAFDDAVRLGRLTVDAQAFETPPDLEERATLLVELGESEVAIGDLEAAMRSFQQAIAIAAGLDSHHRADIAARAAAAYSTWPIVPERDAADDELIGLIESALESIGPEDSVARATLLARLGQSFRWSLHVERGRELVAEAEAIAGRLGDPSCSATVALARRLVTTDPAADEERLERSTAAVEALGRADDPEVPLALFLRFADQLSLRDLAGATTTAALLEDEAHRRNAPGPWWYARRVQASQALLAGHLDRAERLALEALDHGMRAQHPRAQIGYEVQHLSIEAQGDGPDELLGFWRSVRSQSPWHLSTYAWVSMVDGSTDEARVAVEELLALGLPAMPQNANWLALLSNVADVVVELGMVEHVADLRALLHPHEDRVASVFNGLVFLGSMRRAAGRLATAVGDWEAGERHLAEAIAVHDRLGAVLLAADCRADYALLLRRKARPEDATRATGLLDQALSACRSRQALALADRLQRRLTPTAASLQPEPLHDGLSPREIEVLQLVAAGLTNKAIADELHISPATVQRHTINLYRKIGASGRSEAAVYAERHHLLDRPDPPADGQHDR